MMQFIIAGVVVAVIGGSSFAAGIRLGTTAEARRMQKKIDRTNDDLSIAQADLKTEKARKAETRTELVTEFVTKEVPVVRDVVRYVKTKCDLPQDMIDKLNKIN